MFVCICVFVCLCVCVESGCESSVCDPQDQLLLDKVPQDQLLFVYEGECVMGRIPC